MKKSFLKIVTASLIVLSIGACKKDSSSKSKTELLTQKPWKLVTLEFETGNNTYTPDPSWASAEPCEKDNLTTYKTNGDYEETEGATKCDASDPNLVDSGDWSFEENETKLEIDGELASILQLTENTLQVSKPISYGGITLNYRATLSH